MTTITQLFATAATAAVLAGVLAAPTGAQGDPGCAPSAFASAPVPASARAVYLQVQHERDRLEPLWRSGDVCAARQLRALLQWMERPAFLALADGDPFVAARVLNVQLDLARAAVVRADTASARAWMRLAARGVQPPSRAFLRGDSLLAPFERDTAVARALAAAEARQAQFSGRQLSRASLTEDDRIAALSLFWAEVRWGLPNADRGAMPQLDSLYHATLPRVRSSEDPWMFWREMQRFAARVGDGHTNVYPPSALVQEHWARPLVATDRIEGQVAVTGVAPVVEALGIRRGDLVIAVDGEPVDSYATRAILPFVSASTPQDLELRTYAYDLLRGPRAQPVRLLIEKADGRRETVTVPRDLVGSGQAAPPVTDSILADGTGYLRIRTFGPDSVARLAREAMRRLASTPALIVDLRLNDGGSTSQGFPVLRAVAHRPFALSTSWIRSTPSFWRTRGFEALRQHLPPDSLAPDSTLQYRAPAVLLVGPRTFSAGEDFAAVWQALGRGAIIGEPTGGSTGQPLVIALPGGGRARIRTKHDVAPTGVEFDGVGVQPDLYVPRTLDGARRGRDEVLEAALSHLRTRGSGRGAPED